ncbi:VaFE repeat-containing surface-anchored protein, partial [Streptococcus pyogenes]|uniref:VaFE repeat-containing surface-anchored protein n=1 Tax=Streptococcus pyogenes TaxID=1314 RepID=UPI0011E646CD
NKKASPEAALTIEISDDSVKKTVVDTVKYKHLVAGQSYTLTGRLMKLVDGQEPQEVQTATSKFTAEKSEGETTVTFKDVSVDAGATYVVYEKAESDQEIDFKDGKSKHVVEHANKDDKAQTVVVKKAKPEKPAGELQTTVGVDNK